MREENLKKCRKKEHESKMITSPGWRFEHKRIKSKILFKIELKNSFKLIDMCGLKM